MSADGQGVKFRKTVVFDGHLTQDEWLRFKASCTMQNATIGEILAILIQWVLKEEPQEAMKRG